MRTPSEKLGAKVMAIILGRDLVLISGTLGDVWKGRVRLNSQFFERMLAGGAKKGEVNVKVNAMFKLIPLSAPDQQNDWVQISTTAEAQTCLSKSDI